MTSEEGGPPWTATESEQTEVPEEWACDHLSAQRETTATTSELGISLGTLHVYPSIGSGDCGSSSGRVRERQGLDVTKARQGNRRHGAGMEDVPSGKFSANAAWLVCAPLAHALIRWSAMSGEITPADHLVVARTVRTRFLWVPGRLVNISGTPTLRAPLEWPWAKAFSRALDLLRGLPPPCRHLIRGRRTADDRRTALTTDENHERLVSDAR